MKLQTTFLFRLNNNDATSVACSKQRSLSRRRSRACQCQSALSTARESVMYAYTSESTRLRPISIVDVPPVQTVQTQSVSRTLSHPSSVPESGQSASLEYVKVLEERLKNFEKRIDELENTLAEWRTPQTQLQAIESRGTTRTFSGALSMSRRKEELEELAAALALSDSGKKEELLERISNYFEEHPEVKTSPRFEGLFNPRPRKRLRITEGPVPGRSNSHESVAQAPLPPSTFPASSAFKFRPIVPCFTPGGRSNTGHELVNHPYFREGGYLPPSQ